MGNVFKVHGAGDEFVAVVVDFNVVVVVLVKYGGAGADGRTRHGRTESMERKKKSRTENNLMFQSFGLSLVLCRHDALLFLHPSIHHRCVLQQ